ncbi:MAG: ABC transporter permease subunit [Phycisphaerales bacterium]|nr:ABC transporter permease subunit [Phycisphaerales bacterium]
MPALLNWLLRLLPTNPICLRLVAGGSRRWRHLVIRGAYLAVMIGVMLFILLASLGGASMSMRALAASSASIFQITSYVQVLLICLLTPVFMAGAIVHESSPKTWDILLTTPLNSLQIVLGNLFGRYFFVLALLLSSLPLFALLQMFGGVPGRTIIASYVIAAMSALVVAAIAVTLSVDRRGGRRAVFVFYVVVVLYLTATFILDANLRMAVPSTAGVAAYSTTWLTPLNPFLAIQALLSPSTYVVTGEWSESWWSRQWMGNPISSFNWLCVVISLVLIVYSTLRVRILAIRASGGSLLHKIFRIAPKLATERAARGVGHNPVAWRESHQRRSVGSILARWGFLAVGLAVLIVILAVHSSALVDNSPQAMINAGTSQTRSLIIALLFAETIIIVLTAINLSATAVSREREDGSLDLILTTPIQPGPYLAGKHRGLVRYLLPMILLPVISMLIIAAYVMLFDPAPQTRTMSTGQVVETPLVMPSASLGFALVFIPFIAFCVMVGLHWSIRSKGTIGSIVAAVIIILVFIGLLGTCALAAGHNIPVFGVLMTTLSPGNIILTIGDPVEWFRDSWRSDSSGQTVRTMLVIGGLISGLIYVLIAWAMHRSMTRTFMMTVRRLSGTN